MWSLSLESPTLNPAISASALYLIPIPHVLTEGLVSGTQCLGNWHDLLVWDQGGFRENQDGRWRHLQRATLQHCVRRRGTVPSAESSEILNCQMTAKWLPRWLPERKSLLGLLLSALIYRLFTAGWTLRWAYCPLTQCNMNPITMFQVRELKNREFK